MNARKWTIPKTLSVVFVLTTGSTLFGCATTSCGPNGSNCPMTYHRFWPDSSKRLSANEASAYAAYLYPYGVLAHRAYCLEFSDEMGTSEAARLKRKLQEHDCQAVSGQAGLALLKQLNWQRVEGVKCVDAECKKRGLAYAIFKNEFSQPKQLVFAYRGTDATDLYDWTANLHWFLWIFQGTNEYRIANKQFNEQKSRLEGTYPIKDGWQWITTGHSLGGGIATHIAYMYPEISYAIVFDTSPVIAVSHPEYVAPCIARAYEQGEAAFYLRWVTRLFFHPAPKTFELSTNVLDGANMLANHSMYRLWTGMRDIAADAKPVENPFNEIKCPLGMRGVRPPDQR